MLSSLPRQIKRPVVMAVAAASFATLVILTMTPLTWQNGRPRLILECRGRVTDIKIGLEQIADLASISSDNVNGDEKISWRVSLLPYLSEAQLYEFYNRQLPWNSNENLRCAPFGRRYFQCPTSSIKRRDNDTDYVAVCGAPSGLQLYNWKVEGGFKNELSASPMIVEELASGIHWLNPKDLWPIPQHRSGVFSSYSPHEGVRFILFADGSVRGVNEKEWQSLKFEETSGCKGR